ncbi:MAG: hypothetical protein JST04_06650 [Bdellovibrionales bacterium]|nr:hypothetical protein [Bdellovibrionales bacterium]
MTASGHPFIDPVKTLLWIEPDEKFRAHVKTHLEQTGRFRLLANGDEATAHATLRANPRIDLILSDHRAILGNEAIASTALRMGIPIIIVTDTFSEAVRALRYYAMKIPVVKKPIAVEKILALIDHILNGRPLPASPVLAAWWGEES